MVSIGGLMVAVCTAILCTGVICVRRYGSFYVLVSGLGLCV